jgi:hypothetical protein
LRKLKKKISSVNKMNIFNISYKILKYYEFIVGSFSNIRKPIVYLPDKNIFGLKLPGFFMKAGPPDNIEAPIKSMGGEVG